MNDLLTKTEPTTRDGFTHDARTGETTDVWLTPKSILEPLGRFNLDPCHLPDGERPWDTADHHFCLAQDGLKQDWTPYRRLFLNPPYGKATGDWLARGAAHGNAIALVFMRPETAAFRHAWNHASAMLVLSRRIAFLDRFGNLPKNGGNAGAPSVLIAFGDENAKCLATCGIEGALLTGWRWVGGKTAAVTRGLFDEPDEFDYCTDPLEMTALETGSRMVKASQ